MTIKRGISFKEINNSFKRCENISEICQQTVPEATTKNSKPAPKSAKKQKVDEGRKKVNDVEANSQTDDTSKESLEDLRCSYILTMSQSICEINSCNDGMDESEYIFEPFTEVIYSN